MSRNLLALPHPAGRLEIVAGWDRPQGVLFLDVRIDGESPFEIDTLPEDSPLYALAQMQTRNVGEIAEALAAAQLAVPTEFLARIEADQREEVGNVVRRFGPDGSCTVLLHTRPGG